MNGIKLLKRKIAFRYPVSDTFMTIGFVLTFMALFFSRSILSGNESLREDKDRYGYKYSQVVNIFWEDLDELKKKFDDQETGIYSLERVTVLVNDGGYSQLSKVLLSAREDLTLSYRECTETEPWKLEEPCVIIGRAHEKYCYIRDGRKYIRLQNLEYLVTGITGTDDSSMQDNNIILFADNIGENLRSIIAVPSTPEILICSNKESISSIAERLGSDTEEEPLSVNQNSTKDQNSYIYATETNNTLMNVIYMFCMVNCFVISSLWIGERAYEVALRKNLGYSTGQLIKSLYLQILRPLGGALIICILLNVFSRYLYYDGVSLALRLSIKNLLWISAASLVSAFAVVLISVFKSRRVKFIDMQHSL